MLRLNCRIKIGELSFTRVHEVVITSSWKNLTDTATIKLPRSLTVGNEKLKEVITTGQEVEVKLGYNGQLATEFTGYVAEPPNAEIPFSIKCEDEMWQLKQTSYTKGWESANLQDVVSHIASGYQTDVLNAELGPVRYSKKSAAKVLKQLKDDFGLVSYFKNGKLVVGKTYLDNQETVKYDFGRNIIDNDLTFKKVDEVKLKVEAISIKPNGQKITEELGDQDGESRTLHFYDLDQGELKKRAEEEMERLRFAGYRGSFQTFGIPLAGHGWEAELKDRNYPERGGTYFIDQVNSKFGMDGFKRKIELGPKAA